MQDTNSQQDKSRRATPIRIVEGSRLGAPQADALREVHSSLVRAGQNLYNLVQSNQTPNGVASGPTGIAYPQQVYAPSTAASYPQPGFAGFAQPGFAAGIAQAPYLTGIPSAPAAGNAFFGAVPQTAPWAPASTAATPWKALATDIAAALGALQPIAIALGSLQHAATIVPGTAPANVSAFGMEPGAHALACDIFDEGKQFVCLVDLPGIKAAQIELLCVEQAFVVAASREADSDGAALVRGERTQAAMQRTITLPAEIQPAGVKATLNNGVLSVILPKVNPTEGPRRIKVQG